MPLPGGHAGGGACGINRIGGDGDVGRAAVQALGLGGTEVGCHGIADQRLHGALVLVGKGAGGGNGVGQVLAGAEVVEPVAMPRVQAKMVAVKKSRNALAIRMLASPVIPSRIAPKIPVPLAQNSTVIETNLTKKASSCADGVLGT